MSRNHVTSIDHAGTTQIKQNRSLGGEVGLAAWLGKLTRGRFPQVRVPIGDDAAVFRPRPGFELAITTDFFLEDVHFRRAWFSPAEVARRCLTRGLSDLAAMGAEPRAVFLSLAVPPDLAGTWARAFLRSVIAMAAKNGAALAGGDLAANRTIAADIVALGEVPHGRALLRSGARAGDSLCVTGALGGAAAALERRLTGRGSRTHTHMPQPRIAAGLALRKLGATSCMDLSDGVSLDLRRLVDASSVRAEIFADQIPMAPRATLDQALHGGEDYELLFTLPAIVTVPRQIGGVAVHAIGRILRRSKGKPAVSIVHGGRSQALRNLGWQHF